MIQERHSCLLLVSVVAVTLSYTNAWSWHCGGWGSCSRSCGGGSQSRGCSGRSGWWVFGSDHHKTEYNSCNTNPCPVNGHLTSWSSWSLCSKTCGGGSKSQIRSCIPPRHGGRSCSGSLRLTSQCNTNACPAPRCSTHMQSQPSNGATSCTQTNIAGSVCSYRCNTGYELVGASSVTCQPTRAWTSGSMPLCKAIPCLKPSDVPSGGWSGCQHETFIGGSCTLTCNPGYNVIGQATVKCQGNRTWTSPGSCVDVEPPVFSCPSSKSVFSEPSLKPKAVFWSSPPAVDNSGEKIDVTSSSSSGYLFPLGVTKVNMSASDNSGNIYRCSFIVDVKAKYCSPLIRPAHANVTCSYGSAIGSDCTIACLPGFILSGLATRACADDGSQPNGTWSGAQPTCDRLTCGQHQLVSHGILNCSGFQYEDVCAFECDRGYTLVGSATSTCEASKQWSPVGACVDSQPPDIGDCSDIIQYADKLGQNTTIQYAMPQVVDNSGETITLSGRPTSGEIFGIGTTNVVITAVDLSGNTATCNFEVNVTEIRCEDPRNTNLDQSAKNLMEFSCPDGFSYGAKCNLRCSDGNPVSGSSEITCDQNGTDIGQWWYSLKPSCSDLACPAIKPPNHGAVSCDIIANRQVCTLQCQKGYAYLNPNNQDGVFMCIKSNWTPVSNINSDVCIAGRPPRKARVMPDIWYYANSCSFNHTEIKENFLKIINSTNILKNVCSTANIKCEVDDVYITCGAQRKRRSADYLGQYNVIDDHQDKEFSQVDKLLGVTIQAAFAIKITSGTSKNLTKYEVEHLLNGIYARYQQGTIDGDYDMPHVGTTDDVSFESGPVTYECPGLTYLHPHSDKLMCVGCGRGYIYVPEADLCSICPRGTFQSEDEADACLPCPNNGTTNNEGASSVDVCLG